MPPTSKSLFSAVLPGARAYQQVEMQDFDGPLQTDSSKSKSTFGFSTPSSQSTKPRRKRFSGYRGGILVSITICSVVLLLNVLLFMLAKFAWTADSVNPNIISAFKGNCKTAHGVTIFLHLVINLLGSLLLGASNYTMQRLAAPSRAEVDRAHAKQKWLDIGVPSIRNLTSISKIRAIMWLLLGLTSVPLHLV